MGTGRRYIHDETFASLFISGVFNGRVGLGYVALHIV